MTHLFIQKWIVQFPSIYVGSEFLLVSIYTLRYCLLGYKELLFLFAKPHFSAYGVILKNIPCATEKNMYSHLLSEISVRCLWSPLVCGIIWF